MTTEAREQFEKWFGPPGIDYDFKQDSSGMYYSRTVRHAWEVWEAGHKAGRQSGLEEAARLAENPQIWKKPIPPDHGVSNITVAGRYIAAAIREIKLTDSEKGGATP